jgi:hypothetical protein
MNLTPITANRPRALLGGIAAGLLLGLGAGQGVIAINEATHPGRETTPTSDSEKGALPNVVPAVPAIGL